MDIIRDSQYTCTAFPQSSLAVNSSWESDPEYIHQIHLPYRDIVQEDVQCPWNWIIRAKGISSVDAMANGSIYFLNKPLGNTIKKKIPQNSLSDLLFSQENLLYKLYTHAKSNFLPNRDWQVKGFAITIPQVKSTFVIKNQHKLSSNATAEK